MSESRQVVRARICDSWWNMYRAVPNKKGEVKGELPRAERRKMARAGAAGEWAERVNANG